VSLSRYDILFEPVKIGPVTAPNRFYAVPHATGHGWHQPNGAIAIRAMKAEGGWGTVAVQITEISPDTDMANHPMERIWDDSDIPRHAAQVDAIKQHGSLAAIELGHGGMRARNITSGLPVRGPSNFPVLRPEVPVQAAAMGLSDIHDFRESHKAAALRAIKAGYDILYVYAAHDISILSHFLSINTNKRTDEYGGSFDNRLRLLTEVIEDTLDVANGRCAVALRFSVAEPGRNNGLASDGEGRDVVEALAELPDLWDVNISGWSKDSATARFSEEAYQLPYTDFVKSITSKPVVGVGRFTSPDKMVSLVTQGHLDLIGAARPSIADPFLPHKIKTGQLDNIRECIGCNICVSMDSYGLPVRCTQNPTVSEEWRRGWHPEKPPAVHSKKSELAHHLIIGAGPAGLECGLTLLKAGQRVTIADSAAVAGGRVTKESALPGLSTWIRVRDYRLHQINQHEHANLYLNSEMTARDIADFDCDSVVLATGATWRADGVGCSQFEPLNFGSTKVYSVDDMLNGGGPKSGSNIVVYDDDHFYMASVIAEKLARVGKSVSYVTPLPSIATWTDNTLELDAIVERLNSLDVTLLTNTQLHDNMHFSNTLTGKKVELPVDELVFVGARTPNDRLATELISIKPKLALHKVGDCLVPGIVQAAVLSGHSVARSVLAGEKVLYSHRRDQIPF
jgi:dimethylamine/trimethylamine dehydrogenase